LHAHVVDLTTGRENACCYFTGGHSVNLFPRGQVIKAAMLDLEFVDRL